MPLLINKVPAPMEAVWFGLCWHPTVPLTPDKTHQSASHLIYLQNPQIPQGRSIRYSRHGGRWWGHKRWWAVSSQDRRCCPSTGCRWATGAHPSGPVPRSPREGALGQSTRGYHHGAISWVPHRAVLPVEPVEADGMEVLGISPLRGYAGWLGQGTKAGQGAPCRGAVCCCLVKQAAQPTFYFTTTMCPILWQEYNTWRLASRGWGISFPSLEFSGPHLPNWFSTTRQIKEDLDKGIIFNQGDGKKNFWKASVWLSTASF